MNCPNCKSKIQEGIKFCPNCGYHFPSLERGKSTFEVKFLKKIFGKKEAERQEPIQSDSAEKKIVLKKDGKWGWVGLYFLVLSELISIKRIPSLVIQLAYYIYLG